MNQSPNAVSFKLRVRPLVSMGSFISVCEFKAQCVTTSERETGPEPTTPRLRTFDDAQPVASSVSITW